MAKQLRSKKSTISNTLETFKSANDFPDPSEILDDREMINFVRIMKSRELSTFSEVDIVLATNLAMTQTMYHDAVMSVKQIGRTVINERGTPVANPEIAAMNQLSSTVRAYCATLGLTAGQRAISGSGQKARNQAERDARGIIAKASEDDFLA
jgi:phage terminase small subunit